MRPLDSASFPLHGQRLIEASAGTGKTYTIAELYNRLMLGHGRAALDCNQILVVTFTKAATEELRGRLRARINDTLQGLLQLENAVAADTNQDLTQLQRYLDELNDQNEEFDEQGKRKLIDRLKLNLALMDEASIFTIHSLCQRMLKQFAFDTGVLFSAEMTMDSKDLLMQACEDIWRQVAYALNSAQSQALLSQYSGPSALFEKIEKRIERHGLNVLPNIKLNSFNEGWEQLKQAFLSAQQAKEAITVDELCDLIKASELDKRSYSSANSPKWLKQIYAYLEQETSLQIPDCLARFTPSFLESKTKGDAEPLKHPLFNALEQLQQAGIELNNFLAQAWLEQIKNRFFELLANAGVILPNDLIRLLHEALSSAHGEELAAQIRALYPVAMIDEFQDTDALQYEIFNTIYPAENASTTEPQADSAAHALIMIGDPKQAIYGFRGADIFTYIRAKDRLPEESQFTLATNYRSHSQLIAGVNHLFENNSKAFVFDDEIQFSPVAASALHDNKAFSLNGQPQPPVQLLLHEERLATRHAQKKASEQCAVKIAELLQGQTYLGSKLIQAQDIAVLVRGGYQAAMMRRSLLEQGINSVFLVKESVFNSQEAQDLYAWLNAIAHPNDERLLRIALAGSIQNFTADYLAQLLVDETEWEAMLEKNRQYHDSWRQQGIMAALLKWLETDGLAQRIRAQHHGERLLTNLMHLGDLLQNASRKLQGHEALLRWFAERVLGEENAGDEAQLRLESDADLVSIVTIHSSKGLQYPLVFLPFAWADSNDPMKGSDCIYYDAKDEQVVLHLAPEQEQKNAHAKASAAENMRLLYVALTRAEQGLFIWLMNNISNNKSAAEKSALGQLLQVTTYSEGKETYLDINALKEQLKHAPLYLGELPDWNTPARAVVDNQKQQIQLPSFSQTSFDPWRVSSYSALASGASEAAQTEQAVMLKDDEGNWQADDAFIFAQSELDKSLTFNPEHLALTFQKGAQAGSCLHDVLERWDFHDAEQLLQLCQQQTQFYGIALEEERLPELQQWFKAIVNTPLHNAQNDRFCMADIQAHKRLSEMEFHLPVSQLLTANDIDRLLNTHSRFSFFPLQGFLKGFIDLIFEHDGRYYVADYKSNFLGLEASDYWGDSLEKAMLEHAYDLQAWIYTLALDALLRTRLGENYQPEQHLGGVYYLFLRGMHLGAQLPNGLAQAPGVYYQTVDLKQLQQWRKAFFNRQEVEA